MNRSCAAVNAADDSCRNVATSGSGGAAGRLTSLNDSSGGPGRAIAGQAAVTSRKPRMGQWMSRSEELRGTTALAELKQTAQELPAGTGRST